MRFVLNVYKLICVSLAGLFEPLDLSNGLLSSDRLLFSQTSYRLLIALHCEIVLEIPTGLRIVNHNLEIWCKDNTIFSKMQILGLQRSVAISSYIVCIHISIRFLAF